MTANFAVDFIPLSCTPIVRVEAAGYLPEESPPTDLTTSNLVIRLKRGLGPFGVVLLPDGKPAEGATILFTASQEQYGMSGKELMDYGHHDAKQTTGKD